MKMQHRLYLIALFSCLQAKTVMLDPAGHAKQSGRQLFQSFERAETYAWAEQLKKIIEAKSDIRVLLTRSPGEAVVPLQNASFANRTNVDLFVNLHLYKEEGEQASVSVFYLTYDTLLDQTHKGLKKTDFIPVNRAHCPQLATSKRYADSLLSHLGKTATSRWQISKSALGLPLKELAGITSPALTIELGIHRDGQQQELIQQQADALIACLQ